MRTIALSFFLGVAVLLNAQQATIPNLNRSLPASTVQRIDAIEKAVIADEATMVMSNSDVNISALATPTGVAVTPKGTTGATTYAYVVAALSIYGAAPANAVQITTGNASLNTSNYNQITWAKVPGALAYGVYRSTGGATQGLLATILPTQQLVFNDMNVTATGNVPTANTTGQVRPPSYVFADKLLMGGPLPVTVTADTGQTLSTTQTLAPLIVRAGTPGGGITDTTPTGAALVAALPGVKAGNSYVVRYRNTTGQTITIAAGASGVTLAAGNTNTIATNNTRTFLVVFTNVTPGSEAVTVYSIGGGAH